MSKVYLIGDTHWGHKNAVKWREQFSTPEEHDEIIFDNIMSTVTKRDTLWLLGDCIMDNQALVKLKSLKDNVNRLHWVLGNHDTDNQFRYALMRNAVCGGLVDSVHGLYKYKKSWLSHAPIHPDELRGKFNVHGHVHTNTLDDPRYFNVSCENIDYTPINYQEILGRMKDVRE